DEAPGVVLARDPGHDASVIETYDQLSMQRHAPAPALDHAQHLHVARIAGQVQAIDQRHAAFAGLEHGLQHPGLALVAPRHRAHSALGREQPVAVLLVAEDRGEARAGVEARDTQPVDRAGARDEACPARIADERVLFERNAHSLFTYDA